MSQTVGSPTFGFPVPAAPTRQAPVTVPTPLPKRPKGRWFIGLLLLAGCAYAGYHARAGLVGALRAPDLAIAIPEDLVAIGLGLLLISRF